MDVTFDPAKDVVNLAKHGCSLASAAALEWADAMVTPDARRDYGEARMIGYVPLGDRLFCVVYVDRPPENPTERRIISLRKANFREVNLYAANH